MVTTIFSLRGFTDQVLFLLINACSKVSKEWSVRVEIGRQEVRLV